MATTQEKKKPSGSDKSEESPFDDVKDALGEYISAMGSSLADKASGAVGDLAGHLTGSADGPGGTLGRVAQRVLKGDSPLKSLVAEKAKSVKDNVVEKVTGGSGGGGGSGGSSIKATNIVEIVDVGVPLRTAYAQWTQFEDFSGITKGVRSVSMSDETESDWNIKVGPSSRSWKATVQEQVPDERIVWTSEGAKGSTNGAITFHELAPSLTRIVVVVEYYPAGFFEKTGNLWRAQGRRLRLDLKHFARHVTLHSDDELEGWLGEIRDGEVVKSHEEFLEDEENERDDEDSYDDDPEGYDDGDDEPADEDEDDGPYDEEEDEEEEDEDEEADDDEDEDDDRRDRRRSSGRGRRAHARR
ncbi:SRPBCC family protein [Streptomyces sp. NPDC090306]|uniref:SRPBCC family protein n=1 Tax=Streptomyces sp. NPDC090306 TaxID=3365961 RepID=UPI00382F162A